MTHSEIRNFLISNSYEEETRDKFPKAKYWFWASVVIAGFILLESIEHWL